MASTDEHFKAELVAALPSARRFALTLVRNGDDADDLVQSAIEKALSSRASFEPGSNFIGWFNTIIRNIFLDDRKSHRVSRTTLVGDDEGGLMDTQTAANNTESLAEVSEVQDFLFTLPDTERSVLMLWAEGFSYEEISEQLGITRSNAGVILCRARKTLSTEFSGDQNE